MRGKAGNGGSIRGKQGKARIKREGEVIKSGVMKTESAYMQDSIC